MTTMTEAPYRYRAHAYWRAQLDRIIAGLDCRAADDLCVFTVEGKDTALDTLIRGARASGDEPGIYPAGCYTRFVPGKPALIVSASAGWAALCTVSVDGRLATIDDVALWVTS